MPTFDIVCLANSYKRRGRCVAGIRVDGGGWIRPCARAAHGELYPSHYRLPDGSDPRVLDVIRIAVETPEPSPHQPENWLVGDRPWQLIHRPAPAELAPVLRAALAQGPYLFGDASKKIAAQHFAQLPAGASLALVFPKDLQWHIQCAPFNLKRPRARFRLRGALYDLPVTDPAWVDAFRGLDHGLHPPEACGVLPGQRILLTISLGDVFEADGSCYKLVAGIVPIPPDWTRRPARPAPREVSAENDLYLAVASELRAQKVPQEVAALWNKVWTRHERDGGRGVEALLAKLLEQPHGTGEDAGGEDAAGEGA